MILIIFSIVFIASLCLSLYYQFVGEYEYAIANNTFWIALLLFDIMYANFRKEK